MVASIVQYPPAFGSPATNSGTVCVHDIPVGHAQYVAPSSVFPSAFAQRHEQ
jgi:hypothetical protein